MVRNKGKILDKIQFFQKLFNFTAKIQDTKKKEFYNYVRKSILDI